MPKEALGGDWTKHSVFRYYKLQEAAAATPFSTDQDKTTTPTLKLDTATDPNSLQEGILRRVHYRIKSANAVTYTLRLWSAAIANDYESNLNMIYESPAAQVSDTDYDEEVEIPFKLAVKGEIYYSIDWSAASGNAQGFIEATGDVIR